MKSLNRVILNTRRVFAVKLSPGNLIDRKYRIVGVLGRGGMGSVYAAEHVRIARRVAIKVLNRTGSANDVIRFEREARATQIESPHIVQVYDLGNLEDGAPYMVMEYLAGESLGNRLTREGPLHPREVVPIAIQVLDGLVAAHRVGLMHRDLKPDNIFLVASATAGQELVKLLDFGISKFVGASRESAEPALTKSGMAVGTPHYMSPEQVRGSAELDTRTDLYSLGVILYQSLSGRLPFATNEIAPLLSQILFETPSPLVNVIRGFDSELSRIVATAMARRADDRYPTAGDFRHALVAWASGVDSSSQVVAEVLPVEQRRGTSVLVWRGLIGSLLATACAASVVGGAKLLFWPALQRHAPWFHECRPASRPGPELDAQEHVAAGAFPTWPRPGALAATPAEGNSRAGPPPMPTQARETGCLVQASAHDVAARATAVTEAVAQPAQVAALTRKEPAEPSTTHRRRAQKHQSQQIEGLNPASRIADLGGSSRFQGALHPSKQIDAVRSTVLSASAATAQRRPDLPSSANRTRHLSRESSPL